MSVTIRLKRVGMKKQAYYRLVATDRRKACNGAEIEILGHYNPKDKRFSVQSERVQYWLSCGAQVSETAQTLLKKSAASATLSQASDSATA